MRATGISVRFRRIYRYPEMHGNCANCTSSYHSGTARSGVTTRDAVLTLDARTTSRPAAPVLRCAMRIMRSISLVALQAKEGQLRTERFADTTRGAAMRRTARGRLVHHRVQRRGVAIVRISVLPSLGYSRTRAMSPSDSEHFSRGARPFAASLITQASDGH